MSKFVSGPFNTIRVEGKINGIKKVLYIFFEWHKNIWKQTECVDMRSQNIKDYLIEQFDLAKDNGIDVDFFMETHVFDDVFDN